MYDNRRRTDPIEEVCRRTPAHPPNPPAKQRPFIRLVDSILEAKDADPLADTDEMEAEIDRLVYGLYGLTEEEIVAVESGR